ncbi:MAG: hypothetical protein RJA83_351 [Pseudomonadota bacterium]|jgi:hypothetical protein
MSSKSSWFKKRANDEKSAHKKHYNRQSEIEIKLDGRILFKGHKDDSVVNGIIRANPGASIEWVDKSNKSEIILRGIK